MRLKKHLVAAIGPGSLFGAMLLLFALHQAWRHGQQNTGLDYYLPWIIPRAVSGQVTDNVYNREKMVQTVEATARFLKNKEQSRRFRVMRADTRRGHRANSGTPFLYAVFAALTSSDYEGSYNFFQMVSIGLAVVSIIFLCRWSGFALSETLLLAAVVLLWFEPFRSDLRVANVNRLLLAIIVGYLGLLRSLAPIRHMAAGVVLGVACMFKPVVVLIPAVLALFRMAAKRYRELGRELGGIAIGGGVALLASSWFFGSPRCWIDWFRYVRAWPAGDWPIRSGNYAPARFVREFFGIHSTPLALALIPCAGALLSIVWLGRRARQAPQDREIAFLEHACLVSFGVLLFLLLSSLVWVHYFLLTLPLILVSLRCQRSGDRALAFGTLLLQSPKPLRIFFGLAVGSHNSAALFNIALLLLLGLALVRLHRLATAGQSDAQSDAPVPSSGSGLH